MCSSTRDFHANVPLFVMLLLSDNDYVYAHASRALGLYQDDEDSKALGKFLDNLPDLLHLPWYDPFAHRTEVDYEGNVSVRVLSPYFYGIRPALALLFCGPGGGSDPVKAHYAATVVTLCEAVYGKHQDAYLLPSPPPPSTPSPPPTVLIYFLSYS